MMEMAISVRDELIDILKPPLTVGNREIYPVVCTVSLAHEHGAMATSLPLALLIREEDSWYFIPLIDELLTAGEGICKVFLGMK